MSHHLRMIHRLLWVLMVLMMPWMANCVCVSPTFNNCTSSSECRVLGATFVCVVGRCIDPSAPQGTCTAGQTQTCTRALVRIPSNCRLGRRTCLSGVWSTCQLDPARITAEICNGRDDDCDGQVDETFPEKNKACTVPGGRGPCSKGEVRSCTRGKAVCFATTLSRPEGETFGNCSNGVDDNCNGFIDDPVHDGCTRCTDGQKRSCYPFGVGVQDITVGKGTCQVGSQICQAGKWATCTGAVVPATEICNNNIDEDCDGTPDNGCGDKPCKPGDQRACYSGPSSTLDVGTCKGGQQVCDTVGKWGICVGQVLPRSEICANKLDDDCNGILDDCDPSVCAEGDTRSCYTGDKAVVGVGACKEGKESCAPGGTWSGTCEGEVLPQQEVCGNKIDDSCNGKVDDCEITQLISGSWDKLSPLLLWDIKTGKSIRAFQGHTDAVYAARFSPDGKMVVSASHDKQVKAWDVNTGKNLWTASNHAGSVFGLAIDPKGQFVVTASEDKTLRVTALTSGKELGFVAAHTSAVYSMAMDTTGRWVATGSADTSVRLWDLFVPSKPSLSQTFQGHSLGVFAVAFDPKGRWVASGGRDGSVRLWDLKGGPGPAISYTTSSVTSLAFDRRSNFLAVGSSDGSIALFDLSGPASKAGKVLKQTTYGAVYSLTFHPIKDELTSGHYNNAILHWDLNTGKTTSTWIAHKGPFSSLSYRP